jgi:accessory gene regulator B
MERLANRVAEKVAKNGGLDDEKRRVIAYGLGALIQMLFLLLASLIFGLLFHCLIESMIIFTAVGLIKRSAGGAHSGTSGNCTVISLSSIFVMALISRFVIPIVTHYWYIYLIVALLIFGNAFFAIYKNAPFASPHKPITRPEKIRRLRRQSFLTVGAFLAVAVALIVFGQKNPRLINASISLCLAVLWQSFMLTASGGKLIFFIDSSA